jgi:hypothetical protein
MVTAMKRAGLSTIAQPVILAVISFTTLAPTWAQDPNAGDAPNHGVARLSYVQGNVGMRHGDMGELSPAALNVPLVTTDRVATGDTGHAEIQFDFDNMIRLAPSTEVRLSQLEFQNYQVQIYSGTTSFRVLQDNPGQVEISTPTVSVRPAKAGTYRVSVRPDGITEVTVRQGQVEIYGPQGSENLGPGQTMQVRGNPDAPEFQLAAAIPLDDFDRFNLDRDKVMQQSNTYNRGYVPPNVAGGESLDQYGQWQNDGQYGNVWVPNEPPGWAPYQNGQWLDESYYGWSWLGAEPWGWAPYHYGGWYVSPWGWAWAPGFRVGITPFWRPAMVGFFGWGPGLGIGVGFGFGFGHVGWVPLAPFEVYHPWYGAGAVAGRYGVSNVSAVNAFRNASVTNAVSSVGTNEFGHGMVSGASMARPTGADLARASAVRGALPIAPTAASRRVSSAAVNTHGMPQSNSNTRFATRSATAAAGAGSSNSGWRGMNGYNANGAARGNTGGNSGGGNTGGNAGAAAGTNRAGGNPGGTPGVSRGGVAPQSGGNGYATPRGGSYAAPQSRAPQQQPLRMNPPIVQPRSAPSSSGGGGGGSRSAPAPSRSGGGGHSGGGHR